MSYEAQCMPLTAPLQTPMPVSRRWRPLWIPTIAAVAVIAATARMGLWQLDRAHQKEALQAQYERMRTQPALALRGPQPHAERYQRVSVRGEFDTQHEVLLDNQLEAGAAGYHVLTPLRIAEGGWLVMVNRGWIGRSAKYPVEPEIPSHSEEITIAGIIDRADRELMELSAETVQGKVWQNFTAKRFHKRTGLDVLPFVVVQQQPAAQGLKAVNAEPEFGIQKHYSYAVQWFGLAATALLLYGYFTLKRLRGAGSAPQS